MDAVSNASQNVDKAKKALKGMAAGGGKKNAEAASQVQGNLTLAMNQLAAASSYVPFFLSLSFSKLILCLLMRADRARIIRQPRRI